MTAEMASALRRLGAKRVEAELLAALLEHEELGTKELLERTGLRQPEVSVGMQELRRRGWVDASPIPREGKGRPMHKYRLELPRNQLRDHFVKAGDASVRELKDAMSHVKKSV